MRGGLRDDGAARMFPGPERPQPTKGRLFLAALAFAGLALGALADGAPAAIGDPAHLIVERLLGPVAAKPVRRWLDRRQDPSQVLRRLSSPWTFVWFSAVESLDARLKAGRLDLREVPEAVPLLIDALRARPPALKRSPLHFPVNMDRVRNPAVYQIVAMALPRADRPRVLAALTGLSEDSDPALREFAFDRLAEYGGFSMETLPRLKRGLEDPDEGVRWSACVALASFSRNRREAPDSSRSSGPGREAAEAAATCLFKAAPPSRAWMAGHGIRFLVRGAPDVALEHFRRLAQDSGGAVHRAACLHLADYAAGAEDLTAGETPAGAAQPLRREAAEAVGPCLTRYAQDAEKGVRESALKRLERLGR